MNINSEIFEIINDFNIRVNRFEKENRNKEFPALASIFYGDDRQSFIDGCTIKNLDEWSQHYPSFMVLPDCIQVLKSALKHQNNELANHALKFIGKHIFKEECQYGFYLFINASCFSIFKKNFTRDVNALTDKVAFEILLFRRNICSDEGIRLINEANQQVITNQEKTLLLAHRFDESSSVNPMLTEIIKIILKTSVDLDLAALRK
jgi:hypothetical protein